MIIQKYLAAVLSTMKNPNYDGLKELHAQLRGSLLDVELIERHGGFRAVSVAMSLMAVDGSAAP